jgi:hypothetical protein
MEREAEEIFEQAKLEEESRREEEERQREIALKIAEEQVRLGDEEA